MTSPSSVMDALLSNDGRHMASVLLLVVSVALLLKQKIQNDQLQHRIYVLENLVEEDREEFDSKRVQTQKDQSKKSHDSLLKQIAALQSKADKDRKQYEHKLQEALAKQQRNSREKHEKEMKNLKRELKGRLDAQLKKAQQEKKEALQSKADVVREQYEYKLEQALAKQLRSLKDEHEKELKKVKAETKSRIDAQVKKAQKEKKEALQSKADKVREQYEHKLELALAKQLRSLNDEHEKELKILKAKLNGRFETQLGKVQQELAEAEAAFKEKEEELLNKIAELQAQMESDRKRFYEAEIQQARERKEEEDVFHSPMNSQEFHALARSRSAGKRKKKNKAAANRKKEKDLLQKIGVQVEFEQPIDEMEESQTVETEVFQTPQGSHEINGPANSIVNEKREEEKKQLLKEIDKLEAKIESERKQHKQELTQVREKVEDVFMTPMGSRELNSTAGTVFDRIAEEETEVTNEDKEKEVSLQKIETPQDPQSKGKRAKRHARVGSMGSDVFVSLQSNGKQQKRLARVGSMGTDMFEAPQSKGKQPKRHSRAHSMGSNMFQASKSNGKQRKRHARVGSMGSDVFEAMQSDGGQRRRHVRTGSMGSIASLPPICSREISCPLGLMFDVMPPAVTSLEKEEASCDKLSSDKDEDEPLKDVGSGKEKDEWPVSNVRHLHENDVIVFAENGNDISNYPGNKRYQDTVNSRKSDYANSTALDRPLVALEIIKAWRNQDPPGRFMGKDNDTGLWCDVGEKQALDKTTELLREETPSQSEEQDGIVSTKSHEINGHTGKASSQSSIMQRDERWEDEDPVAVIAIDDPSFRKTSTNRTDPLTSQVTPGPKEAPRPVVPEKSSPVVHCQLTQKDKPTVKQILKRLKDMTVEELFCEETVMDDDVVTICRILRDSRCVLTSLTLKNCGLTALAANALAELLETNETIQELDISHNAIGQDGLGVLVEPLATRNKTLKRLVLQDNRLTAKCASSIGYLLRANTTITDLFIGGSSVVGQYHFGPKGIKTMAPDLNENTTLKTLSLSHNKLGSKGAKTIASKVLQENNTIAFLDLACNGLGHKGTDSLATVLLNDKTVSKLNLESNNLGTLGANSLVCVIRYNCTLTWLKLGNNKIGDVGAIAIAEGLLHNVSIVTLTLDWNGIGNAGVEAIASSLRKNTTLKTLDMSSNLIGTTGAIAMAESLPYNVALTELNITDNQIGDEGARAFCELIFTSENGCFLQTLHCNENNLSDECIEWMEHVMRCRECDGGQDPSVELEVAHAVPPPPPAPEEAITPLLFPSPSDEVVPVTKVSDQPIAPWLTRLLKDVEKNRIFNIDLTMRNIGDDVLIELTAILLDNHSVRSLYLNGENITSEGMAALAVCLVGISTLERLYIRGCQMEGPGLDALVKALGQNQSLKSLSLVSCGITSDTAGYFADMLRVNNRLSRLNLCQNKILDDGLEKITDSLRSSDTKLTSLAVASNGITDLGLPHLDNLVLLTELRLDDNRITDEGVRLLTSCNNGHCQIQWLSISDNEITEEGKATLKSCMPKDAILIC